MPFSCRVTFDSLLSNEMPRSETALFTEPEATSNDGADVIRVAVERWRSRQKAA